MPGFPDFRNLRVFVVQIPMNRHKWEWGHFSPYLKIGVFVTLGTPEIINVF